MGEENSYVIARSAKHDMAIQRCVSTHKSKLQIKIRLFEKYQITLFYLFVIPMDCHATASLAMTECVWDCPYVARNEKRVFADYKHR
jgi:hypothetical protein